MEVRSTVYSIASSLASLVTSFVALSISSVQRINTVQQVAQSSDVIYVLELERGKYYVGRTNSIDRRMEEHRRGEGAEWTKRHKIVKLIQTFPVGSDLDEDLRTKEMMIKYGIQNVRGGTYCRIWLTRQEIEFLSKEFLSAKDVCYKCGAPGHYIKDCPESSPQRSSKEKNLKHEKSSEKIKKLKHADSPKSKGKKNDSSSESETETKSKRVVRCSKCKQTGHYKTTCKM